MLPHDSSGSGVEAKDGVLVLGMPRDECARAGHGEGGKADADLALPRNGWPSLRPDIKPALLCGDAVTFRPAPVGPIVGASDERAEGKNEGSAKLNTTKCHA